MKYWKYKDLSATKARRQSVRPLGTASALDVKTWLRENITDQVIRDWYLQEAAKDFLIERG